jgi:NADPH-dependent curcumin reductase CurA
MIKNLTDIIVRISLNIFVFMKAVLKLIFTFATVSVCYIVLIYAPTFQKTNPRYYDIVMSTTVMVVGLVLFVIFVLDIIWNYCKKLLRMRKTEKSNFSRALLGGLLFSPQYFFEIFAGVRFC